MATSRSGGNAPATPAREPAMANAGFAVAALAVNAFVWGVSWWPLRQLDARGLHPLWATVSIYAVATAAILLWRPTAAVQLARTPALWVLFVAAGTTNASFNWAVTMGDVVRIVLLFYLMPVWAVLLARVLLRERLTARAGLRVAMALAGAATVLWPPGGGVPLPRTLAEWLGVVGGISFALNNVMLKREAGQPEAARALAMFSGGVAVALVLALALGPQASPPVPWPPSPAVGWVAGVALLSVAFLGGNLALQYGASRLPANVTAVVMLTEVLFAAGSALLLGAGVVSVQLLIGGGLIVGATLLSARWR